MMKWPEITKSAAIVLVLMTFVKSASLPEERLSHRDDLLPDIEQIPATSGHPTVFTEISTETNTILPERNVCQAMCNSSQGEVCSPNLKTCVCPIFTFRSSKTGHCKAQVAVNIQLNSSKFQDEFAEIVARVNHFVEVSPHFELKNQLNQVTVTIYVDAEFFKGSWTNSEKELRSLFASSELEVFWDLSVSRDLCENPKTHPCTENALCITSTVRYHVECFCQFNYRDLSGGLGRKCVRELRCLNGGLSYVRRSGTDVERFDCQCVSWFAGEECELDLLSLGIKFAVLIAIAVVAIWTHPIHCMSCFHRCRLEPLEIVEITRYSGNAQLDVDDE
ncbi:hypothetical protein BIW11_10661 [Tropilaelaps mercedesae]|uniref:EGF-like domain-containing protein n=1 Tax=Tropilaelaps mercedesae TaxID=418985 RepID=A0A1V9XEL5_9ACAR|nr:hypothetical protein BIW11_10661 [Tropilaelaps mercedesae]